MHFITIVLRNLFRRPTRTWLTVSGIAIAVTAVVALVGIARGFATSLLDTYESRGVDLVVSRAGSVQRMSAVLDAKLESQIRRLPRVKNVSAGLLDVVSFEDHDLFGVGVQGLDVNSFVLNDYRIIEGHRLREGEPRTVLLGTILARNLNKKVGDVVELIENEPFTVVGIFESYNLFENGAVVVPLKELQRVMGRENDVTLFMVVATSQDRATLEALREQITQLAPGLSVLPTRQYVDSSPEIRMAGSVAWLTSAIALIIGSIGTLNTMIMSVFERTSEIGVLRAVGWSKWTVMRLVLLESIVLTMIGATLGTIAAILLTQVLSQLPASGRLVEGHVSPDVILQGFAIALLVGVAGGVYPAMRASRLSPTEALRHQ
jgi:putative ABC transport system permease protein